MRKFLRFATAAGAFCLALLAGSASAATVIFDFTGTGGSIERPEAKDDGTLSFTFRQRGIALTVTATAGGTASNPVVVRDPSAVGGLGVLSAGETAVRGDALISRGESLFLTFSRTVTLSRIRIFDGNGDGSGFRGGDADHFYVLRPLDGTSGDREIVAEEGNVDFAPINPFVTAQRFELFIPSGRTQEDPFDNPDAAEFGFFLASIEVIPEPSTALLTGAGLFALGFAGRRRRRA